MVCGIWKKLLIFFVLSVALQAQTPQDIFEKFRPKICKVQFYKNVSSQAKIGSYIKIKQNRVGVVVSPEGLIMVNSDVYPLSLDILSGDGVSFFSGEPTDFRVELSDGREYVAEFVGKDEQAQVAFLRIGGDPEKPFSYVQFRTSDSVSVGQTVYLLELLGENYNFKPLFSNYAINAILNKPRRKFLIKNGDTALSAGGLIISSQGAAIGVTLRNSTENNFHEAMDFGDFGNTFLEIAPTEWFISLIENPPVLESAIYQGKAWFGIGMQALTPELKNYWHIDAPGGVIIDRVYPDSPADKAGLNVKDVIVSFNEQPLDIQRDEELGRFREMIARETVGETLPLKIVRNGAVKNKKLKLAAAPRTVDLAEKYQLSELGIEVRKLTRDILYDYNLPLDTKGVYVFQVDRAAPAGLGGLETGSIIKKVNGQPVTDLLDFQQKIEKIMRNKPKKLMFQTQFRRDTQFVFVDTQ